MDPDRHSGPRRVALVAEELLGYVRDGLGTTTTFFAVALARLGHSVEVLYLGPTHAGPIDPEWQRLYDGLAIRVREVPRASERVEPPQFARARDVELALRSDPPELVVVQDLGAPAYTAMRLRRLGLAFERTSFLVLCHGTRQWITDVSRKVRVLPGAHTVTLLERASLELADAVVSPSEYLVGWMRDQGWRLPANTFVIPHVSRSGATGEPPPAPAPRAAIKRIAFFGRLEDRKGIAPFLGALNELDDGLLAGLDVEFVGRPTPSWPVDRVLGLLTERTKSACRSISFSPGLDQHEALARLRLPGTLAVMPSFAEAFGNTVRECLEQQIPFLAGDVAAIRELVDPQDRDRVLCEPSAEGVAAGLRRALTDSNAARPARAAVDDGEVLRRWQEVLALPLGATVPELSSDGEWSLHLGDDDVPEPDLYETLVRAQRASGADVVTCGILVDDVIHLFPGEPRALGLLANGYGTIGLVRAELLEDRDGEAPWPLFARLSAAGAHIVSVPLPLARSAVAPATLERDPAEARIVLDHLERAVPHAVRFVGELASRLASEQQARTSPPPRGLARRAARRLLAGWLR